MTKIIDYKLVRPARGGYRARDIEHNIDEVVMYWIGQGYQPYGFPMTELESTDKDIVQIMVKYESHDPEVPKSGEAIE